MDKWFYILFLLFFFDVGFCSSKREPIEKHSFNAFVYAFDIFDQALLKHGCSGAIVTEQFILTAATCLYYIRKIGTPIMATREMKHKHPYRFTSLIYYGKTEQYIAFYTTTAETIMILANESKVYIGTDQPMKSSPFDVKEVHEHPYYQYGMPYYDLALLQLATEIFLIRGFTPVKLTTDEAYYAVNNSGLITGYGAIEENETMASRYLHSVRAIITPPESCDQESNNDSNLRKTMRNISNSEKPNEHPIFCARVHEKDDGMCKGWHIGSPFTVGVGKARRLIGIVSTPNICHNSGAAIITSIQGMGFPI